MKPLVMEQLLWEKPSPHQKHQPQDQNKSDEPASNHSNYLLSLLSPPEAAIWRSDSQTSWWWISWWCCGNQWTWSWSIGHCLHLFWIHSDCRHKETKEGNSRDVDFSALAKVGSPKNSLLHMSDALLHWSRNVIKSINLSIIFLWTLARQIVKLMGITKYPYISEGVLNTIFLSSPLLVYTRCYFSELIS